MSVCPQGGVCLWSGLSTQRGCLPHPPVRQPLVRHPLVRHPSVRHPLGRHIPVYAWIHIPCPVHAGIRSCVWDFHKILHDICFNSKSSLFSRTGQFVKMSWNWVKCHEKFSAKSPNIRYEIQIAKYLVKCRVTFRSSNCDSFRATVLNS